MLRTAVTVVSGLIALLAIVGGVLWIATEPEALPSHSTSAKRFEDGPLAVLRADFEWVDEGRNNRPLSTSVWFPVDATDPVSLLVFSHGFMSSRFGCTYMAEHLASHGYVVVSADHPLTNAEAPDGPDQFDVVNQPADITFLIDQTMKLGGRSDALSDLKIDSDRIGAFGISLGANTVTLAGFHPIWRDPRIKAVVSIVGHGDVFGRRFFENADIPFLMIAGTADAIVDYEVNAAPIPKRIRTGGLLTLEGATHAGFTDVTSGALRILGNPDNLGCGAASPEDIPQDQSPFVGVFGEEELGLITPERYRAPCAAQYEDVLKAGRQQDIAKLAVRAFFDSHFGQSKADRESSRRFLETTLPEELAEVSYRFAQH